MWRHTLVKASSLPRVASVFAQGSKRVLCRRFESSITEATAPKKPHQRVQLPSQAPHVVSTGDKILLLATLKFFPGKVPAEVPYSVINSAWARAKIVLASASMAFIVYGSLIAIDFGRDARDGGDECLYDSPTARKLQEEKREYKRQMMAQMEALEKAQLAGNTKV